MVRYYGYYSNKSRGLRKKADTDDLVPVIIESDVSSNKSLRQNWARLIQKIYKVDPLLICTKCQGPMRIIAFIEDDDLIERILRHLNLGDTNIHDPPPGPKDYNPAQQPHIVYDDHFSQLPTVDYWIQ